MPPGTNAAVAIFHYGLTIQPTELVPEEDKNGYANVSYDQRLSDNKLSLTTSPGSLSASTRARTRILAWADAQNIGNGDPVLQEKRAPGQSTQGIASVRMSFELSTEESPTRITVKPSCNLVRVKRCKATVGSGRVTFFPYFDDGSGFTPAQFALGGDYDEILDDDGGIDPAFEQLEESRELKEVMNYYSTSISETLNYDANLDPEGIPVLQEALRQLFELKQLDVNNVEYYYNQLSLFANLLLHTLLSNLALKLIQTLTLLSNYGLHCTYN